LQITSQSDHSLHGYSDAHDWVRDNDDHYGVDIAYYLFHEKKTSSHGAASSIK